MQDAYRATVASLHVKPGSDGTPALTPRTRLVFEALPDRVHAREPSELIKASLPLDVLCAARAIASAVADTTDRTKRADAVDAVLRAVTAAAPDSGMRKRGGADRELRMQRHLEELSEMTDEQVRLQDDRQLQLQRQWD